MKDVEYTLTFTNDKPAKSGWYLVLHKLPHNGLTSLSECNYSAKWDAFNAYDEAERADGAYRWEDCVCWASVKNVSRTLLYEYTKERKYL